MGNDVDIEVKQSESATLLGLSKYCECVETGCKPVAALTFPSHMKGGVIEIINGYNLKHTMYLIKAKQSKDYERLTVYIYKYRIYEDIIKYINANHDDNKFFWQWAAGKMFGYSDESIVGYINKK